MEGSRVFDDLEMSFNRNIEEEGRSLVPRPFVDFEDDSVVSEAISTFDDQTDITNAQRLAKRYRLEFVDVSRLNIEHELFRSVPADLMLRYGFIPSHREKERLVIVVSDPSNLLMVDEVTTLLDTPIRLTVGTTSAIESLLKRSGNSQRLLDTVTEELQIKSVTQGENKIISLSGESVEEKLNPIIRFVDTIIFAAIERRASDIHIQSGDDSIICKYRIDGVLQSAIRPLSKRFHGEIISRIKVMAELDIAERRIPQDGRFSLSTVGKSIDFRVSIMPSIHGEDAVIRILDKESISKRFRELSLEILGFQETELKRFRKHIAEPYGMVLVTGPTGSGKTTTLYAALSEIKSTEDKIITIEDPVEYQLEGTTQIPIDERKGLTFARGLRSILRHDPDKIMVGEIRDPETAQIAVQSALTGHLVFTTVHANNVFDVLGRFLNMGVERYQIVSALNCVLAQRLVRVICSNCKETISVTRDCVEESGFNRESLRGATFCSGTGCMECEGTGYRGRTAICEFLELSDNIKEMILDGRPTTEIKVVARTEGMRLLRESAVELVLKGVTTLHEINKVTGTE